MKLYRKVRILESEIDFLADNSPEIIRKISDLDKLVDYNVVVERYVVTLM